MLTAYRYFSASRRSWISPSSEAAKAWNSWPTVMGTASCSSVRPILTISMYASPFARNEAARRSSSAISLSLRRMSAILIAVGYESFVDCDMFRSSCGSTIL